MDVQFQIEFEFPTMVTRVLQMSPLTLCAARAYFSRWHHEFDLGMARMGEDTGYPHLLPLLGGAFGVVFESPRTQHQ